MPQPAKTAILPRVTFLRLSTDCSAAPHFAEGCHLWHLARCCSEIDRPDGRPAQADPSVEGQHRHANPAPFCADLAGFVDWGKVCYNVLQGGIGG
jgi:hypothetical protein